MQYISKVVVRKIFGKEKSVYVDICFYSYFKFYIQLGTRAVIGQDLKTCVVIRIKKREDKEVIDSKFGRLRVTSYDYYDLINSNTS